ncbi:MAG: two pore domain potassium channel family protein [Acidimicrobiales bacterium]|nr:two pore domain potassium channel family protein [Acidimicrobiales bacterium]
MSVLLLVAGVLVVFVALFDAAWTTVATASGAGPISRRLAPWLWGRALALHHRRPSHGGLAAAGVGIIVAVFLTWIGLVLSGWALVFASSDGAVRAASTGRSADLVERLYFTGYTVFTLGNGEYRPGLGWWQILTVVATATGLVLVTLAITFLVPLAGAAAGRRQLASTVASLGEGPHAIVANAWTGRGFGTLSQHLVALTSLVHATRQEHLTYPMLHFFHSETPGSAAAVGITHLGQALQLLDHGVAADVRLDPAATGPLGRAIDGFLETLEGVHISADASPLVAPDLEPLRAAGIPTVDDATYAQAAPASEPQRRLLAALLGEDGWPQSA